MMLASSSSRAASPRGCSGWPWPIAMPLALTKVTIEAIGQEIAAVSRDSWNEAKTKARFNEVDKAVLKGPQTLTKRGRKAVVSGNAKELQRKCRRSGSLAAFFATSPLHHSGLEIERSKESLRDVDL